MYHSGTGTYAFENCKAIHFASSIKLVGQDSTETESQKGAVCYHPLLVSVKNCANATKRDGLLWLATMVNFLKDIRAEDGPTAVCLIVLMGCSEPPSITDKLTSFDLEPFPHEDVYRLVCVPEDGDFGISQSIQNLGIASEKSEIYSSHAFMPYEDSPQNLLRKKASVETKQKVDEQFDALRLSPSGNGRDGRNTTEGKDETS